MGGIDDTTTATTIKGSIIEVDYYHAEPLLVMDDTSIVTKVKNDLNTILGRDCIAATVVDAAIVRLPQAVNWYSPGSYANMPDVQSSSIPNVYFAGDIVRTRHGSWSQEKAFVTGREAANSILGRDTTDGIIPLDPDEAHVAIGRNGFGTDHCHYHHQLLIFFGSKETTTVQKQYVTWLLEIQKEMCRAITRTVLPYYTTPF